MKDVLFVLVAAVGIVFQRSTCGESVAAATDGGLPAI